MTEEKKCSCCKKQKDIVVILLGYPFNEQLCFDCMQLSLEERIIKRELDKQRE